MTCGFAGIDDAGSAAKSAETCVCSARQARCSPGLTRALVSSSWVCSTSTVFGSLATAPVWLSVARSQRCHLSQLPTWGAGNGAVISTPIPQASVTKTGFTTTPPASISVRSVPSATTSSVRSSTLSRTSTSPSDPRPGRAQPRRGSRVGSTGVMWSGAFAYGHGLALGCRLLGCSGDGLAGWLALTFVDAHANVDRFV